MRIKKFSAQTGVAFGLILALLGPGISAVGYFSHPVGNHSTHGGGHGGGGEYPEPRKFYPSGSFASGVWDFTHGSAWDSYKKKGPRSALYVSAQRERRASADASLDQTSTQVVPNRLTVRLSWSYCNRSCTYRSFTSKSKDNSSLKMTMGPLMKTATISGLIGGKQLVAELTSDSGHQVFDFGHRYGSTDPIFLAGYEGAYVATSAYLTNATWGNQQFAGKQHNYGSIGRTGIVGTCASNAIPYYC